jgi:hypothetical protein
MGHHHEEVGEGQVHHKDVRGRPQGLRLLIKLGWVIVIDKKKIEKMLI